MAVIMFSRAPVTATISGLRRNIFTFKVTITVGVPEWCVHYTAALVANMQRAKIDCLWQFLSVDSLASGISRASQTILSTTVALDI
jgi:hypothetical protein